jgi:vacuolar-type H+-ATPase subunit D/Vma8
MVKNTDITERVRLQFRSEFINALNHPQFNNPNTTPTNTSFGRLTTANQLPRVIQFGLKLLF